MKQTGDLNLMKKINKSIVLSFLRQRSPISRAEIAKLSGLTKATVSNLVNELHANHLVAEGETGQSSGGRKPMMLHFRQDAGYAIGVDLGVNYIAAVLTDLQGIVMEELRFSHHNESQEHVIGLVKDTIQQLIDLSPQCSYGVIGIGIGVPGICDDQGQVLFAPNLAWVHVPLQAMIEQHFQIPVILDNEANAGAQGQLMLPEHHEIQNLIYLSMNMGIGAGVMINHELYRGTTGFAGEMGHMSIMHTGISCKCGNVGCWELYASEQALLERARTKVQTAQLTLEYLIEQAEQHNEFAIDLFSELGHYIGIGLTNIIHSFNPQRIIIGGRLALAQKWIQNEMMQRIEQRTMTYPRQELLVQFSPTHHRSTLLGASSFVIERFFASTKISHL